MKKVNLTRFWKKNGSTILTCVGVIGTVTTTVMAVKSTPKAMQLLKEATDDKGEDLTVLEKIKVAGPSYIPAAIVGVSTIGCICGANMLNVRQQASLASAYAFVDSSYRNYQSKVKEIYGEEAHQKIIDSIAQEKVGNVHLHTTGCFEDCSLEEDDDDTPRLFYDSESERYFESSLSKVISAEYHFNRNFAIRGYATLNELYSLLGIAPTDDGDLVGWSCEDMITNCGMAPWIDFNHRKVELDEGLTCYIIETSYGPCVEAVEEW